MKSTISMSRVAFVVTVALVLAVGSIVSLTPEAEAWGCSFIEPVVGEEEFCIGYYSDPGLTNMVGSRSCDCDGFCDGYGQITPYRDVQYCYPCN